MPVTADPLALLRQLEESIITLRSDEKSVTSTIDDEDYDDDEEEEYEEEEWDENRVDMRKKEHGIYIYISIILYFIYPLHISVVSIFFLFPEIDFVPPPGEEDKYIMVKVSLRRVENSKGRIKLQVVIR